MASLTTRRLAPLLSPAALSKRGGTHAISRNATGYTAPWRPAFSTAASAEITPAASRLAVVPAGSGKALPPSEVAGAVTEASCMLLSMNAVTDLVILPSLSILMTLPDYTVQRRASWLQCRHHVPTLISGGARQRLALLPNDKKDLSG